MVYKLGCPLRATRPVNGSELPTDVVGGVTVNDGVKVTEQVTQTEGAA